VKVASLGRWEEDRKVGIGGIKNPNLWDLLNLEINVVARLLNDLFTSIVYS
jgi:hypothetical protein